MYICMYVCIYIYIYMYVYVSIILWIDLRPSTATTPRTGSRQWNRDDFPKSHRVFFSEVLKFHRFPKFHRNRDLRPP